MRFLADQDIYRHTFLFLIRLGHEVVSAAELGMSRAGDSDLLLEARRRQCVLITRDKDFGALVFLEAEGCCGVILLRLTPASLEACHAELARVLAVYSEAEIRSSFWSVEPGRHRRRKLTAG
jgi:predicted nuclease of predicted toxin-antitoxin system